MRSVASGASGTLAPHGRGSRGPLKGPWWGFHRPRVCTFKYPSRICILQDKSKQIKRQKMHEFKQKKEYRLSKKDLVRCLHFVHDNSISNKNLVNAPCKKVPGKKVTQMKNLLISQGKKGATISKYIPINQSILF